MKKFKVKFQREFEVDVHAETIEMARTLTDAVLGQFPKDTCKLLSIYAEDYKEPTVTLGAEPVAALTPEAKAVLDRNAGFAAKVRGIEPPKDIA